MNKIIIKTLAAIFVVCVTNGTSIASEAGQFVFAGLKSVDADVLSANWGYGIRLNVSPSSISKIKLSCNSIPGSRFTTKEGDIKPPQNGILFLDGPVFRLSKETTPWLYEDSETTADCKAVIVFHDKSKKKIKTSITYSSVQKVVTLAEFKSMHEYNKKKGTMKKAEEKQPEPGSNSEKLLPDEKGRESNQTSARKPEITGVADKSEVVNENPSSTNTFRSMFSGKTVSGRHMKKGFTFKNYFADNGQLIETRDNGKHKKGNWTIDEQGRFCIDWKNRQACGQLKLNSDNSVSFVRNGQERRRYDRFETGNTLDN